MRGLLIFFWSVLMLMIDGLCNGLLISRIHHHMSSSNYITKDEFWFNQTLDHFSPYDHRKFQQRYYEYLDHFKTPDGPIFLVICGESTCGGISNDYITVLAKKFGAAMVTLEHRYYGKSSPFKFLTTENLKYLSSKQALYDLAAFRQFYQDHRKFQQRYYEYLDHFKTPDGPIFLVICGESTCGGISNDYITVLAKKFGAAMVTLEHRYYGKSSPFKFLTTENLKYLSSKQALYDLAAFRQFYQKSLNLKLNRADVENPWFVFGISYAGALSAWFRLKFPHLTCGSLASSGVVHAILDFTQYDQQIGESVGPECKAILQEVTQLVEKRLDSDGEAIKTKFGASVLKVDGDFMYYLADAAADAIQYGNPDKLCPPMTEAKKAGKDLVDAYAKYVNEYYVGVVGVNIESYTQEYLKNVESRERLWWFQVCTEVAFFQVAPANDSIRSSKINTAYHLDLCKNVFGEGVYPVVNSTNLYYGGTDIAGSKIVFTNGSQDPWRHASKEISSPNMPSYIVNCQNCGHGSDLRGCPQSPLVPEGNSKNCSSPESVNKVRQQMIEHIDLWLSQCHNTGRSSM